MKDLLLSALRLMAGLDKGNPPKVPEAAELPRAFDYVPITAEMIEAMIDKAGRDKVMSRARQLGWSDGGAPLWVWNVICAQVEAENKRLADAATLAGSIH